MSTSMKAYAVATESGWTPANQYAMDLHSKCKEGVRVAIDIKRPRNLGQHNKLYALARLVINNLPESQASKFPSDHAFVKLAQIRCGYADYVDTVHGPVALPWSISFDEMGQDKFAELFGKVVAFVTTEVIPGLSDDDLRDEIAQQVASF